MMSGLTKYLIGGVVILGLFLAIAALAKSALTEIHTMVTEAAQQARDERDAHWRAEIEAANARTAKAEADQAIHAMKVDQTAADEIAAADRRATELEKDNASLPDTGRCGLSRERVQLLNKE
jgi:hypothetical protein